MISGGIGQGHAQTAFESARQGMARAQGKLDGAAGGIAAGEITSSRMVEMIESKHLYTANARVIRAQDEMLGTLLSVKR